MPVVKDKNGIKIEGGHTATFYSRIDSVIKLILENDKYLEKKRNKALTELVIKTFKVSDRMARTYITEAKKEVNRMSKKEREKSFIKALRNREYLLTEAKQSGNLRFALAVMQDRDRLLGLYPPNELKHSGELISKNTNIDVEKLTDRGLRKLKEMIARGENLEFILTNLEYHKQDFQSQAKIN